LRSKKEGMMVKTARNKRPRRNPDIGFVRMIFENSGKSIYGPRTGDRFAMAFKWWEEKKNGELEEDEARSYTKPHHPGGGTASMYEKSNSTGG